MSRKPDLTISVDGKQSSRINQGNIWSANRSSNRTEPISSRLISSEDRASKAATVLLESIAHNSSSILASLSETGNEDTLAPIIHAGTALIKLVQDILTQQLTTGEIVDISTCPAYSRALEGFIESLGGLSSSQRDKLMVYANLNVNAPELYNEKSDKNVPKSQAEKEDEILRAFLITPVREAASTSVDPFSDKFDLPEPLPHIPPPLVDTTSSIESMCGLYGHADDFLKCDLLGHDEISYLTVPTWTCKASVDPRLLSTNISNDGDGSRMKLTFAPGELPIRVPKGGPRKVVKRPQELNGRFRTKTKRSSSVKKVKASSPINLQHGGLRIEWVSAINPTNGFHPGFEGSYHLQ